LRNTHPARQGGSRLSRIIWRDVASNFIVRTLSPRETHLHHHTKTKTTSSHGTLKTKYPTRPPSRQKRTDRVHTSDPAVSVKVAKVERFMRIDRNDEAYLAFDIDADLTSIFSWQGALAFSLFLNQKHFLPFIFSILVTISPQRVLPTRPVPAVRP
jgi:hypothetical protein